MLYSYTAVPSAYVSNVWKECDHFRFKRNIIKTKIYIANGKERGNLFSLTLFFRGPRLLAMSKHPVFPFVLHGWVFCYIYIIYLIFIGAVCHVCQLVWMHVQQHIIVQWPEKKNKYILEPIERDCNGIFYLGSIHKNIQVNK